MIKERLTRITNDELETFRLNFSKFPNRSVGPYGPTGECMTRFINEIAYIFSESRGYAI